MVTRLVACFGLGGLLITVTLGAIEYTIAMRQIEQTTSQQIALLSRNLQNAIERLPAQRRHQAIPSTLNIFSHDTRITGALLTIDGGQAYASGQWPKTLPEVAIWNLSHDNHSHASGLAFDRPTLLNNAFTLDGRVHRLKLLIDGPTLRDSKRGEIATQLSVVWAVLATLLLIGLAILRRWLVKPMARIVNLLAQNAPAQQFQNAANTMRDEFADLAASIANMLHHIDETKHQLDQREYDFEHLYQFAPIAMVSIDQGSRILTANRRAATMLGFDQHESPTNTPFLSFVHQQDRALFRQAIRRAETKHLDRREFRLNLYGAIRDVRAEFTVIHNQHGQPHNVRISLQDITESKQLIQTNAEHRQQLDLIVNHIADAILLVSHDQHVITANNAMGLLLRENPADLTTRPFNPQTFWLPLDFNNPDQFLNRIANTTTQPTHAMRDQFEAADGTYQFQIIPVFDELKRSVAHLWIIKEVSAQARSRRLLEQQTLQIKAIARIGKQLQNAPSPDAAMTQTLALLTDTLNAEAMGVALYDNASSNPTQVCWQGGAKTPLTTGPALATAVTAQLLPRVTHSADTSFWTDITRLTWAKPFADAGLETLVATPLIANQQPFGVIWFARRSGKPVENHRIHLLEALAPLLAIALENKTTQSPNLPQTHTNLPKAA